MREGINKMSKEEKKITRKYKRQIKRLYRDLFGSGDLIFCELLEYIKYLQAVEVIRTPVTKLDKNENFISLTTALNEYELYFRNAIELATSTESSEGLKEEIQKHYAMMWKIVANNLNKWGQ